MKMSNNKLVEKMMADTNKMIQLLQDIKALVNKYGDQEVIKNNGGIVKLVTEFLEKIL